MAMASVTAPFPAPSTRWPPTSLAVPATLRNRATASRPEDWKKNLDRLVLEARNRAGQPCSSGL